ncbi:predicted protein [Histoplasma mississippiense (nom. inval.)]|uniref:predicted protein n=1 Tax=Ajellomyces capsulatus (strain NAm1 / WU24) TaxID=2059318 RepID=UPI000157C823|nr:predicted protein [Histoplasma mississippiense (nom. inval.)]EDN09593.1 predicted protein [Histoplasma mississippiense (nom. inval.)]
MKDIDIAYESVLFNGSFTKASIYRQPPGPLVDEAWLALGTRFASVLVPEDEAENYGIKQGQVKRMKEQGGGFFAHIEVFHHLHCVNLLRQTSHFNFEYYSKMGGGPFLDPEERLKTHIGASCPMIPRKNMPINW